MITGRKRTWAALTVSAFIALGLVTFAQQQQSGGGGSTVTVSSSALPTGAATEASLVKLPVAIGSATSGQSGPLSQAAATTGDPTYTTAQTNPLSMDLTGYLRVVAKQTGTWNVTVNAALPTGGNVIGIAKTAPLTSCGATVFSQTWIAVPTTPTSVTGTTTCVVSVIISNTNAGAQTITVTDGAGTPLNIVGPAYVVPGLSQVKFPFDGTAFTSGLKWTAGGTGVTGAVLGYQ